MSCNYIHLTSLMINQQQPCLCPKTSIYTFLQNTRNHFLHSCWWFKVSPFCANNSESFRKMLWNWVKIKIFNIILLHSIFIKSTSYVLWLNRDTSLCLKINVMNNHKWTSFNIFSYFVFLYEFKWDFFSYFNKWFIHFYGFKQTKILF